MADWDPQPGIEEPAADVLVQHSGDIYFDHRNIGYLGSKAELWTYRELLSGPLLCMQIIGRVCTSMNGGKRRSPQVLAIVLARSASMPSHHDRRILSFTCEQFPVLQPSANQICAYFLAHMMMHKAVIESKTGMVNRMCRGSHQALAAGVAGDLPCNADVEINVSVQSV